MESPKPTLPELADRPDSGWDDDVLADIAAVFLDAVLSSADVSVIGVASWWDRARTALETGCAVGDGVRQVAARVAKKLQVATFTGPSSRTVTTVAGLLTDPGDFARWRHVAARDAIYVTAVVRLMRDGRRDKTKPTKPTPTPSPALVDTIPGF